MRVQDVLVERVLGRDRLLVLSGLVSISALSWCYTWYLAWDMQHSHKALCGMSQLLMFAMWVIMMVAMMVPSAAPMILLFAAVNRKRREQERPFVSTGIFLLGYLVVWSVFSAVATIVQWHLHETALLTPMMVSASPLLSGSDAHGGGPFSIDATETHLFEALPVAARLSANRLAGWRLGSIPDGTAARQLLSGLLLAADGSAVCGRRHEPRVAGCHNHLRSPRKGRAGRNAPQSRNRATADRMGPMDGRRSPAVARGLCVFISTLGCQPHQSTMKTSVNGFFTQVPEMTRLLVRA